MPEIFSTEVYLLIIEAKIKKMEGLKPLHFFLVKIKPLLSAADLCTAAS